MFILYHIVGYVSFGLGSVVSFGFICFVLFFGVFLGVFFLYLDYSVCYIVLYIVV